MRPSLFGGPLLAGAALLLMLPFPKAARAQTSAFANTQAFSLADDMSGSQMLSISNDGGTSYFDAYVGRYVGQIDNGPATNVFCTDINHEFSIGGQYQADTSNLVTAPAGPLSGSYYTGGLASALNSSDYKPSTTPTALTAAQAAGRASEVAYLTDRYLNATAATFSQGLSGSTSLSDNLAGVNLAIWDIVQDGGSGLQGPVRTSDAQYIGLADYYEALAAQNSSYQSNTAYWVQAPRGGDGSHYQDYVITAAVPEPSTLAFLGIGLAGLGLWAARRRCRRA